MKSIRLNTVLLVIILLVTFVGCEKEYHQIELNVAEKDFRKDAPFILPINFGEYNISNITKSSEETAYHFSFDPSMLDYEGTIQKEVKPGVIYTETPLKGVLYCRTTSDYIGNESDNANAVQARVFHIKKEFCLKDSLSERLITMIPTADYYASDTKFSYLELTGFTGTVITSSLEGELIDVWGMKDGRIGVGKFIDDEAKSFFAKLEFFELPNQSIYANTLTKSDHADTLDACYVVASYMIKNSIFPTIFTDYIFDPIGNTPPDPELQLPGGGMLPDEPDEDEGTIYYRATLNTKFCNGQNTVTSLLCAKNSELELAAKSSNSDSCLFFCWKIGDKVYTHEPSFVITMDKSYIFNAIYHSSDDAACYELAKTVSDAAFIYKMDSLRNVMNIIEKETGLAKRSDGTYYRLTEGAEESIVVNFEPSVKYNYLYHTHPSGYCLPSGQDLLILYGMIGRVIDYNLFRFGIVTQNDIMALKINNRLTFKNFIDPMLGEFSGDFDRIAAHLQQDYILPITARMTTYNKDVCLQEISPLFNSIGIGVYYSSKEQSGEVKWKYVSSNSDGTIDYSDCYNK